ncbi:MAG: 4a-hydroxytetrahydrobiopterin dehydratase [bacterium]|nr:4a-hydroxytetrahydrobiopterin dehydratase [bacterium]
MKCVPCEGGAKPLSQEDAQKYLTETSGWALEGDAKSISHEFKFKDFMAAMAFVDQVADIAEMEDHHPDIHIFYNRVKLELSTHAIKGLSKNDFIVAAKIATLPA